MLEQPWLCRAWVLDLYGGSLHELEPKELDGMSGATVLALLEDHAG
jgi:hypothetical protein